MARKILGEKKPPAAMKEEKQKWKKSSKIQGRGER